MYNPNLCAVCQKEKPMSPMELLHYGYEFPVCSHECYDQAILDGWGFSQNDDLHHS